MTPGMEGLAKTLLGSTQGMKLLMNMDKVTKIINSEEGRKMLSLLAGDGGDAIKQAAKEAADGDGDSAKRLMTSLMSTPEGMELIKGITEIVKNTEK